LQFKPESYVTVVIETGGGERLAIPREAVLDTGVTRYTILALADGYFEPREIEVSEAGGEFYPVVSGLQAGDRVVTSAQFLIDSETNLQAAMQAMSAMPMGDPGQPKAPADAGAQPATRTQPAANAAPFVVSFASQPDPPHVGENAFEVTVKEAGGQPVTDARVNVIETSSSAGGKGWVSPKPTPNRNSRRVSPCTINRVSSSRGPIRRWAGKPPVKIVVLRMVPRRSTK
jgi:hypothetical protein